VPQIDADAKRGAVGVRNSVKDLDTLGYPTRRAGIWWLTMDVLPTKTDLLYPRKTIGERGTQTSRLLEKLNVVFTELRRATHSRSAWRAPGSPRRGVLDCCCCHGPFQA